MGGSEHGHGFGSEVLAHPFSPGTRLLQTLVLQGPRRQLVQGADPAKNNLSEKTNDFFLAGSAPQGGSEQAQGGNVLENGSVAAQIQLQCLTLLRNRF